MKSISAEYAAFLERELRTEARCVVFTLTNGTVKRFTDHDVDLVLDEETFFSVGGFDASDVATSSDLNVDNLEANGMTDPTITHPSITEEDLLAGLWDYAAVQIFTVNWADLSMGTMSLRSGRIGEVSLDRGTFKAEFRGLMQAYTRMLGRIETPGCAANLGDAECQVDLAPLLRNGTITRVNADRLTLYDTGSAEAGPSGGIAITHVSNANPAVVTTSGDHGFSDGEVVTLSGIVGPALLNVVTVVLNPSGNTFELGVDTSDTADYPAYISGGTATPGGAESSYFDDGILAMTSGANDGIAREIKSYVPGQFTLQYPFPYDVEVGDTYTATPGCDKSFETCRDRFDNVVNFRGFPYLPGSDKIIQVGRRS